MTSYCSLLYLGIFLPGVILGYTIAPRKLRPYVLLAASYVFFWELSGKLLIYLLFTTLSIYLFGRSLQVLQKKRDGELAALKAQRAKPGGKVAAEFGDGGSQAPLADKAMSKEELREARKAIKAKSQRRQRFVLAAALLLQLGILSVLKYSTFFLANMNSLSQLLGLPFFLPVPSFIAPMGISFDTLQAVSYLVDVYRETLEADRHLPRVALYMAFFPTIMEGPICRYSQVAASLWEGRAITWHNLTFGIQRIAFGMLKKMVIADRLNSLIETVYTDYARYDGGIIALGMFFYTCQLYMEFSGTMDVVIGSGQIFGVTLPENFRQPFLSRTIGKFWTRWHITLGTWFKDYIFYPLTMSKPLNRLTVRARKRLGNHFGPMIAAGIALFAVWFSNGLWHGAGWNYLFFGLYHFVWILFENITEPLVVSFADKHGIDREASWYRALQIGRTILLVNIGELFFRAEGLQAGLEMFRIMVTKFTLASFADGTVLTLGMDVQDFLITLIALVLVLSIHLLWERGIDLRETLARQKTAVRWAVYYAFLFFIILFGAYGVGYLPVDPIYAAF